VPAEGLPYWQVLFIPGQSHLERTEQAEQIVVVLASPFALGYDTRFHEGILFEQVQSQLAQNGEVLGRMALTNPAFGFSEGQLRVH
jgi:hypothetical protein